MHYSSRSEAVNDLAEKLFSGNINDEMIKEAQQIANARKAEDAKIRAAAIQERKRREIENNVPTLKFPKLWNLRKFGQNNLNELTDYCQSYNLVELEAYLHDLQNGQCDPDDFKDNSGFAAMGFLATQIRARKNKGDTIAKGAKQSK